MLLLCLLLAPMVLTAPIDVTVNNYIISIVNDTLISIEATGESSNNLNLSGLGLRNISTNVFHNLSHLKNLDLGNNSLFALPEFSFAKLTRLEHLSLADNEIDNFKNAFVGLNNLKTLNISNNPLNYLTRSSFFGLPKSINIFTHGVPLFFIETSVFENSSTPIENHELEEVDKESMGIMRALNAEFYSEKKKFLSLDPSLRVQICITDGIVTSLEVLTNDSDSANGCRQLLVKHSDHLVSLIQSNITGFKSNWYHLQAHNIRELDIGQNDIEDVTDEMLNDLPPGLEKVILNHNKIKRLVKGRITNQHLRSLSLDFNAISEIDDGALENTAIKSLGLHKNQLNSTRFVATLPDTIEQMDISENQIHELSAGCFSMLAKLTNLNLGENNITEIKSGSFSELSALKALNLYKNEIQKIESGSFQNLKSLKFLSLRRNRLRSLERGVFTGLDKVLYIDIGRNQLTRLTKDSFDGLSDTLVALYLDFNQIDTLENGTFVNVPNYELNLNDNKISKVEKGWLHSSTLFSLYLANNSLSILDGDSFEGITKLRSLVLDGNGITKIEKGFAKNLGRLFELSLLNNTITKLENGALFGLNRTSKRIVGLLDVPVEIIQGGLFDDV